MDKKIFLPLIKIGEQYYTQFRLRTAAGMFSEPAIASLLARLFLSSRPKF
jgi:hypothetical protein